MVADRIAVTIEAGGELVDDTAAPAIWVLADPQGNRACLTTSQCPRVPNWFDSAAERQFANLLDADITNDGVQTWCRIQRGEFHVDWREGRYTPDFFVHVGDVHYLVEVKGDWRVNDPDVQAKKTESKRLARAITDEGTYGDWRYVLIAEEDLDNLHTVGDLLAAAAG